jgi:hypothetical protein
VGSEIQAKRKTTVYWSEELYEELRRLAFERRTSINKLVAEAVEAFVAKSGPRRMKGRR